MVKRLSDIDEEAGRKYVLVCSEPKCLYVIVPTKVASLDLSKVKSDLGARAQVKSLDDSMLEISNGEKKIYLNSAGEIWTSEANDLKSVNSPAGAVKELRKMMASDRMSFEILAEDLIKEGDPVLAEPVLEDTPVEMVVVEMGGDIINDLMDEPEVQDLCEEDQGEVAVMVMDELLADKKASYLKKLAFRSSKILSGIFENMSFEPIGSKIRVSFDSKMASSDLTKEDFMPFFVKSVSETDFYSKISSEVEEIRSKTASELPDYSKIRGVLLQEIKEQKNET